MTRIPSIFLAVLASIPLVACEESGREYPRGYTDDGVKFAEDNWRYFFSAKGVLMSHYSESGKPQANFSCNFDQSGTDPDIAAVLRLERLKVSTSAFIPLPQWPQPALKVRVGRMEAGDISEIIVRDEDRATLVAQFQARERSQLLAGLGAGDPVVLTFGEDTLEIPGPPKSMREAFAAKCMGER